MDDSWEFENENVTAEVRRSTAGLGWVGVGGTHSSLLGVRIDLFPLAACYTTLKKRKKVVEQTASLTAEEIRARAPTVSPIRRRA